MGDLSGLKAPPLQTALAWNAALARSLPATTPPAPRTQAVVRKQAAVPDLQAKVLQPPALATTGLSGLKAPPLQTALAWNAALTSTPSATTIPVQAGRTLMRLPAPMALSGPPALPLQTALAWNAALASTPSATTMPAPRTQA